MNIQCHTHADQGKVDQYPGEQGEEVDAIFYSDKKSFFEASTLIDLTGEEPKLIREGRIKFVELMKKLN